MKKNTFISYPAVVTFFKKLHHRYSYYFLAIMIIAIFLRVYKLYSRVRLDSDSSRDVLIIVESIHRSILPLIGPFSSAGAFVTGPLYYWLLIPSGYFFHVYFFAPWLFLAFCSICTVIVLMKIAYLLGGNKNAVITGILACSSPILIYFSLALTNPTFILLFSSLILLSFILLMQEKKIMYAILLGLLLGIALNMHYQALNLLIFLPAIFFIKDSFKNKVVDLISSIVGFFITLIPILIWDSNQSFANTRNVLDYFLIGEYRIYVPNSWKIFLFTDMPNIWSQVFTTIPLLGLISMIVVLLFAIMIFRKFKKNYNLSLILVIFFMLLFVNRYYHGLRSVAYLFYLIPFLIIFLSLGINYFFFSHFKQNRILPILGYLVLISIFLLNINGIKSQYSNTNSDYALTRAAIDTVTQRYPGKSFTVYDYKDSNLASTLSFSLVLSRENKESNSGIPIGICSSNCPTGSAYKVKTNVNKFSIYNLQKSQVTGKLGNNIWHDINQTNVYDQLIGWSNKHELTSSFDLRKYILSKI